jgi:hypothetical protein
MSSMNVLALPSPSCRKRYHIWSSKVNFFQHAQPRQTYPDAKKSTHGADKGSNRGADGKQQEQEKEEQNLDVDHLLHGCSLDGRRTSNPRSISAITVLSICLTHVAFLINLVS